MAVWSQYAALLAANLTLVPTGAADRPVTCIVRHVMIDGGAQSARSQVPVCEDLMRLLLLLLLSLPQPSICQLQNTFDRAAQFAIGHKLDVADNAPRQLRARC